MSDQLDLRSTQFLGEARDWLSNANARLLSQAGEATALVRETLRKLERIGEDRLEELRAARAALDAVEDNEDDSREQERLEEALEAMQRYRQVAEDLEHSGRRFIARASELSERGRHFAHAGIAFLDERLEALGEYMAVRLPDDLMINGALPLQERPSGTSMTVDVPFANPEAPVSDDLPPGFGWLDIAAVDQVGGFIDDPKQFRKAGYAQMRRGLEILHDEIIPKIRAGTGFTREDAERLDREGGTVYTSEGFIHPDSRVAVWEAFLNPQRGADVVVVERGSDGKMKVVSGRHRLGLARQLGMQAIPARILGSGNGA